MFYERHWNGVSKHMAVSLAGEIAMIVRGVVENSGELREQFINNAASNLYLGLKVLPDTTIHENNSNKDNFSFLRTELNTRLNNHKYNIYLSGEDPILVIEVQIGKDLTIITASRKRIETPTTYIFTLWMISTAIIFVLIAILFMRTQLRSIIKLSEVAEKFGRGQDIPNFKPSGATEVRQASQAFIDMKERINRQVIQRTEMLAGVSHDLKTPLTRMKLQLALMEQSQEIEELQEDIIQMERMVQEYLDFAKGKERVSDANVNISDMLRSIVAGYRNLNKRIDINTQNGLTLNINANSLRRAITNIIDNALKYGNRALLTSRSSKEYAYITIDDDGPGICASERTAVFRPFFRLDVARNMDKGGTGLGLAIARDIIVSYGGEIFLETSEMGGLKVIIKLPI
jgi:two-component system osmolarity sensor histidine kinase EnvZ